jgi:hypothetical protein
MAQRLHHEMAHVAYEAAIRERFVAQFPEPEFSVVGGPATRWPGQLSQIGRQIDVGVLRSGDARPHLVADAKRHGKRLDVPEIEAFLGFMRDVGCPRGVLASLLGGSPAAIRRAAAEELDLHVVDYAEALSFDWERVAAGIFPWDETFHPVMVAALRLLNRGRDDEFIDTIEELHFEEWQALFVAAPSSLRATAARALRTIAEVHPDSGWRFNALRVLDEAYGGAPDDWARELRTSETDGDVKELLDSMLSGRS